MVLVSLNLNEYHMPTNTVCLWTLYIRLQNGVLWLNQYKLVITTSVINYKRKQSLHIGSLIILIIQPASFYQQVQVMTKNC